MTSIEYIFMAFHLVTWTGLVLLSVEIQSWKKEIRSHIDYDNSLRAMRKNHRNK